MTDAHGVPYLQIVIQRHPMDCSVAVLAMLLGESYERVLTAFRHNVIAEGASIAQMQQATRRLGAKLVWTRKLGELDTLTGILVVASNRWKTDHLVIVKEGLIFDTDATVWELEVFMAAYNAKPLSLLEVVK